MKKVVSLIAAAGLTAAAILGAVLSGGSGFWFASAAASVLCCIPFFLSFEKRAPSAGELVLIAVMTAFLPQEDLFSRLFHFSSRFPR